jgi:hypothetical protein
MKRIGLAIALGENATEHTRTFVEGVEFARRTFPSLAQIEFKLVSDERSAEGGRVCANNLLSWGAEAIVGHFSSVAAAAALPIYTRSNVPTLLPAATARRLDALVIEPKLNVYRYQRPNDDLIDQCIDWLSTFLSVGSINFIIQDNAYGNDFASSVVSSPRVKIYRKTPARISCNDAYVIIGFPDFACNAVSEITRVRIRCLVLLDEAAERVILDHIDLPPGNIFEAKCASSLENYSKDVPFWNETMLALCAAGTLVSGKCAAASSTREIDTSLGVQRFSPRGVYESAEIRIEELAMA